MSAADCLSVFVFLSGLAMNLYFFDSWSRLQQTSTPAHPPGLQGEASKEAEWIKVLDLLFLARSHLHSSVQA